MFSSENVAKQLHIRFEQIRAHFVEKITRNKVWFQTIQRKFVWQKNTRTKFPLISMLSCQKVFSSENVAKQLHIRFEQLRAHFVEKILRNKVWFQTIRRKFVWQKNTRTKFPLISMLSCQKVFSSENVAKQLHIRFEQLRAYFVDKISRNKMWFQTIRRKFVWQKNTRTKFPCNRAKKCSVPRTLLSNYTSDLNS